MAKFVALILVALLVICAVEGGKQGKGKKGKDNTHHSHHSHSHGHSHSHSHHLHQPPHSEAYSDHCCCVEDWTFAITNLWEPGSFVDGDGTIQGFDIDIIQYVCMCMDKRCDLIFQPFIECSRTIDLNWFPGRGLMDSWFQVCAWWTITEERKRSVDFCGPYKKADQSYFAVRSDSDFDSDDTFSDKTIIIQNGFVSNRACLEFLDLGDYEELIVLDTVEEIVDLMQACVNEKNDVAFFTCDLIENLVNSENFALVHESNGNLYECGAGNGMMVNRNSHLCGHYFYYWWNYGFRKLVDCGCYASICDTWGWAEAGCLTDLNPDPSNCSADDCAMLGSCCTVTF